MLFAIPLHECRLPASEGLCQQVLHHSLQWNSRISPCDQGVLTDGYGFYVEASKKMDWSDTLGPCHARRAWASMLAHAHCRQPHIGTGAMGGRGCKVERLMCKIETGLPKGDNIMARFGMHLSIAGGFTNATSRAVELGCDCFQIFSRNPRTLRAKPIDRGAADAFRSAVAQAGLEPVVVHVNYLVNVASPKDETYEASVSALTDELLRAEILGADYLVLHPGNHLGSGVEAGSERIARAIDRAYEHSGSSVMICLENMAGAGTEIGVSFGELRSICDLSERGKSLGICFDTCHAYGAGYDVSTDRGLDRTLGELDAEIGLDRLMFVHANDSKGQLGAARDRHEHIGEGLIGVAGFRAILRRKELRDLPFILETPVNSPDDQVRDLAALRAAAGEGY